MVEYNENRKDKWVPEGEVNPEYIKKLRTEHREKFRFLLDDKNDKSTIERKRN